MLRAIGTLQQPVLGLVERGMGTFKPVPKPDVPAEPRQPFPPTEKAKIDQVINALDQKAQAWAETAPSERAKFLRRCITSTLEVSEEAATVATKYKGSYGGGIGEELLSFIPIVSGLREFAEALEARGAPRPHRLWKRPGTDQWIADVFPMGLESILFGGTQGELWLEPGTDPTQGLCYRDPSACPSGVGVVLGAGNQTPVAALDILHVLVVCNQVVCCKMNPVNEFMGPFLRRAFQPLVDLGFLEFIYGGGAEGATACNHPKVASVHLTGSAATYDAVVWQGKPKTPNTAPPFTKPVGAELGCVTPYLIVPGKWSKSDLQYHAETVVTGMSQNSGHNCLKAEIVVVDAGWEQRDEFLEAIRKQLGRTPTRKPFYPGTDSKIAEFKRSFPDAEEFDWAGEESGHGTSAAAAAAGRVPWLLKAGLTPETAVTDIENWCGVLQEVILPDCGDDPAAFLKAAVKFSNEKCWGTLSCCVIIHPVTQKAIKKDFEAALENLQYGTVCVNLPGTVGFAATKLAWGGWPGATPFDIGSGDSKVHNTLMYDHVQKSVLRGAWKSHPHPFWFVSNRNSEAVAKAALKFMANPSILGILPLASQALKG